MAQVRTPLPVYAVGTVSGNAGSPTVAGVGTNFVTPDASGNGINVVQGGDVFIGGGASIPIRSVDSATQITLELPLPNTINTGSNYRIIKYQPNQTGSVLAALLALQAVGSDAAPEASLAVDNGAGRMKLRVAANGHLQLAVGPANAADAALVTVLDVDQSGNASLGGFLRPLFGSLIVATQSVLPPLPKPVSAGGYVMLVIDGQTFASFDASPLFTIGAPPNAAQLSWNAGAPGGMPLLPGTSVSYLATV